MVMDLNTMEEYPLEVGLEEGNDTTGEQARDFSEWRGRSKHTAVFVAASHEKAIQSLTRIPSHAFPSADGHVVGIAAGGNHSLAVTRSGRVYQFGSRAFLQPSLVDTGYIRPGGGKEQSVKISAVAVAAGEGVSALVDSAGALFTWGKNLSTGMLGHKEYSLGTTLPVRVEALVGLPVAHVSLGSKHAAAVIGASAANHTPLR